MSQGRIVAMVRTDRSFLGFHRPCVARMMSSFRFRRLSDTVREGFALGQNMHLLSLRESFKFEPHLRSRDGLTGEVCYLSSPSPEQVAQFPQTDHPAIRQGSVPKMVLSSQCFSDRRAYQDNRNLLL